MAIPLGKLFLIIANTIAAHMCVRPPQPIPGVKEQARYREREETKDVLSRVAWILSVIAMVTNAVLGVCELYLILSTAYPSIQTPLLHHLLLPSPAQPLNVENFYITPAFVLGSLFIYSGSLLRYLCYRTLGRHFTFQLSLQKGHKLMTEGPYGIVRHPSYLGMTLALPGMIVAQMFSRGTWWAESGMWGTWQGQMFGVYWIMFSVYILGAMMGRVSKEDLMLRTEFKDEWVEWARKTPYAVIPYVW